MPNLPKIDERKPAALELEQNIGISDLANCYLLIAIC